MPVTILANKNDLCHPFEYGIYLQKQIPGEELIEIPDKDTDGAKHKEMINQVIKEFLPTSHL